ncbi:MAG: hypothetical protein DRP70_11665 [Spirochaetes bacterium]|nr:MAG: hypothetical protein DRP70_11665 [Spirochaetota bacterium]RKX97400.1 MAG: hypothetical protein DRZ90_06395 [Spirochaetota bacterium]
MRDLLKEFDNGVTVIKEWNTDDTGKTIERFVVTQNEKDVRSYPSIKRAMDRAISIASKGLRKK